MIRSRDRLTPDVAPCTVPASVIFFARRKPRQRCDLAEKLTHRKGWRAEHRLAREHVAHHPRLSPDARALADPKMARKPALRRNDHVVFQDGRTGNSRLRNDYATLS